MNVPPPSNGNFVAYPRGESLNSPEKFNELVKAYNTINVCALLLLTMIALYIGMGAAGTNPEIALVCSIAVLVNVTLFIIYYFRSAVYSAKALNQSIAASVLIGILLLMLPCGAILALLSVQQRLRKPLMEYGVKPTMSGITKVQVQEVERQFSQSG